MQLCRPPVRTRALHDVERSSAPVVPAREDEYVPRRDERVNRHHFARAELPCEYAGAQQVLRHLSFVLRPVLAAGGAVQTYPVQDLEKHGERVSVT